MAYEMRISDWSSDVCSSDLVQRRKIGPGDLHADRGLDAGRQHVDAIADRLDENVGETRYLEFGIQLLDDLLHRHAGPPFIARLQLDQRFEHFEWCGIGGGVGAASLAEHRQVGRGSCRERGWQSV